MAVNPSDHGSPSSWLRTFLTRYGGLLLLFAIFLPLRVDRARCEGSIWIDETYSFLIARQPVAKIVDLCAIDTNPPGYFLALKVWMKLARVVAGEPGVLWARLLSCLGWLILTFVAWFGGGRLLGRPGGTILAWSVAGSAYAALFAKDARGYSLASVALLSCFILLCLLSQQRHSQSAGRAAVLWALYVFAAAVALWTHLLSSLVLVLLFSLWLLLAILGSTRSRRFLVAGALSHAAILLLFLPWLLVLREQIASLQKSAPTWMTAATIENLLSVFWYWYPFGPVGLPQEPPSRAWIALGLLSIVVPLIISIMALRVKRSEKPGSEPNLLAAGVALSILFVLALWVLHRLGIASVFHAPRYPGLAAPLWAAGLTGIAIWAIRRLEWNERVVWLLLAPWLVSAVSGQFLLWKDERHRELLSLSPQAAALLPPPGSELFVFPEELAPFHRTFLGRYRSKSIDELPCAIARGATVVAALNLNPWHLLDSGHDLVAREALEGRVLAGDVAALTFPEFEKDYTLYRLTAPNTKSAHDLCTSKFQPFGRDLPASARALALPEDQRYRDGWSYPEVGPTLELWRWGATPRVLVRFDRELPPGDYVLHYRGYRSGSPAPIVTMQFTLNETLAHTDVQAAEGDVLTSLPFHLDRTTQPVLWIEHPLWVSSGSTPRPLSSVLKYAWIESRPAPPQR